MPQKPKNPWDDLEEVESANPWDDLEPITDMDIPPVAAKPEEPIQLTPAQMESLPDISSEPSVLNPPSLWEKLRTPATNIFSRAGQAFKDFGGTPDLSHLNPYEQMEISALSAAPPVIGSFLDQSTAPLDATATLATAGGSKFGLPAVSMLGRLASGATGVSGLQRMYEGEGLLEKGMGLAEAIGGFFGAKSPKPNVAEVIDTPNIPTSAVDNITPPKSTEVSTVVPEVTPKIETRAKVSNLDYSPSSLNKAEKIVDENGLPRENLTANQIIELAEALKPGYQGEKIVKMAPEISPGPTSNKPKVTLNADGTWTPEKFPDYKVNAQTGEVVGTHSGKPIEFPTPEAKKAAKRHFLIEAGNTLRALVGSADLSFPLRQGLGLIHQGAWWKSWGPMVKSFGSDSAYKAVIDSIADKPFAKPQKYIVNGKEVVKPSVYERAGLVTTGGNTVAELEHFKSKAENLPWVKASNRAYTAFAHKLRSDTFDSLVADFAKAGIDVTKDDEMLKQLGGFVNAASGRGNLGALEKYADGLNAIFFSPRLMASRVQMGAQSARGIFDPKVYTLKTPSVRREYIKSMLAQGAAWGTMAGLMSQIPGAEVNMDPTHSDFGKVKIGNTRLDPAGGLQQFVVLANRIARQQTNQTNKETGENETIPFGGAGPYDPNTRKTIGNFLYNKEAPLVRMIHDWANRNVKEPFDPTDQFGRMVLPILIQDILEVINDPEANPAELLTAIPGTFGVGTQTYGSDSIRRRLLGPNFGSSLAFPRESEFQER